MPHGIPAQPDLAETSLDSGGAPGDTGIDHRRFTLACQHVGRDKSERDLTPLEVGRAWSVRVVSGALVPGDGDAVQSVCVVGEPLPVVMSLPPPESEQATKPSTRTATPPLPRSARKSLRLTGRCMITSLEGADARVTATAQPRVGSYRPGTPQPWVGGPS